MRRLRYACQLTHTLARRRIRVRAAERSKDTAESLREVGGKEEDVTITGLMCNNEHGCLSNGPDGSLPAARVTYDRVFHEPRNAIVTHVNDARQRPTTISRCFATLARREMGSGGTQ